MRRPNTGWLRAALVDVSSGSGGRGVGVDGWGWPGVPVSDFWRLPLRRIRGHAQSNFASIAHISCTILQEHHKDLHSTMNIQPRGKLLTSNIKFGDGIKPEETVNNRIALIARHLLHFNDLYTIDYC